MSVKNKKITVGISLIFVIVLLVAAISKKEDYKYDEYIENQRITEMLAEIFLINQKNITNTSHSLYKFKEKKPPFEIHVFSTSDHLKDYIVIFLKGDKGHYKKYKENILYKSSDVIFDDEHEFVIIMTNKPEVNEYKVTYGDGKVKYCQKSSQKTFDIEYMNSHYYGIDKVELLDEEKKVGEIFYGKYAHEE